jgi:SulP family sulfate permease
MAMDAAAIDDIDYTAASMLTRVAGKLRDQHVRLIITSVVGPARKQLDRYGISAALGSGAFYDTPGAALMAYHACTRGAR